MSSTVLWWQVGGWPGDVLSMLSAEGQAVQSRAHRVTFSLQSSGSLKQIFEAS